MKNRTKITRAPRYARATRVYRPKPTRPRAPKLVFATLEQAVRYRVLGWMPDCQNAR